MAVYLLHFSRPYQHAAHYLGSTSDLSMRLAQHRAGTGARLTAVVVAAGIDLQLARTWLGGRSAERALKRQRHAPRLCPICTPLDGAPSGVIRAVLLPPDVRGHWGTRCALHGTRESWPSRQVATIALRQPADWCPGCVGGVQPSTVKEMPHARAR